MFFFQALVDEGLTRFDGVQEVTAMDYGSTIRILLDTGQVPMGTTINKGEDCTVKVAYRVHIVEQLAHDTDLPQPRLVAGVWFQVMITTTGTQKISFASAVYRWTTDSAYMIIIATELVSGGVPWVGVPVIVLTGAGLALEVKKRNILFDFGKYPISIGYESGPLSARQRTTI